MTGALKNEYKNEPFKEKNKSVFFADKKNSGLDTLLRHKKLILYFINFIYFIIE
jgi:hypothetical protein